MRDLIIYGCGSVGRMVEQIVFDINRVSPQWNVIGFIDDDSKIIGTRVAEYEVLGDLSWLDRDRNACVALGISNPKHKQTAIEQLFTHGSFEMATLVHPKAWVSRRVEIGQGSVVYPGVHIDVDVTIGRFALLNKLCSVGHDTVLGDYSTAAPGVNLGGNCNFGEGVEFGINSSTIQNICIGAWSVIGAGSVVVRDISPNCVAYGVPAKVVRGEGCVGS